MDLAGDNATKRGISLAESLGFNLKIIDTYSGAKDPAEIILENPQNWQESIQKTRTIMDYYFDSAFTHFDKNAVQGRKGIEGIILPAIKRLPSKIEQSHWIGKLAQKLGVREEAVMEELKNIKIESATPIQQGQVKLAKPGIKDFTTEGRKKLLEDKIVTLVFKDKDNVNLIDDSHLALFSDETKSFVKTIRENNAENLEATFANILGEDKYKDFLNTISLKAEEDFQEDGPEELQLCLAQLKDITARQELGRMSESLKGENTELREEEIKKEFDTKAKKLHNKK
jgi:DNA primase